jgi:hypothetical protein
MPRRTQVGFLCAIIVVTCLLQAFVIWHAAVPALDAVRFVNSAKAIDQSGLLVVLPDQTDPPLFPVAIWGVHSVLASLAGDFRESWAFSVQLAAALPLILMPIPVFLLGNRLVGPHAAIFGTVLVLCLPELVRLGADGISDSTYLLGFSVALVFLVAHLQPVNRSDVPILPALLAGAATAIAMLARSEAMVLAAAFGVVITVRGVRRHEVPWQSAIPYVAGLSAILGPYALALAMASREVPSVPPRSNSETCLLCESGLDSLEGEAPSFAPKDPTTSIRRRGLRAASLQLLDELPKTFGYLPGVFALVGFWVLRRRPVTDADRLLQAYCVLFLGVIVFHTTREGYLSSRHLLPLAVAATACFGAGSQAVAERLSRALDHTGKGQTNRLAAAAVLLVAALCTHHALRPLHQTRMAHRSAARWLAQNANRADRVVDTQGWTGLYSGLTTVPYGQARAELSNPGLRYLVVEDRELVCDSRRSRTILHLVEKAGALVATFSAPRTSNRPPPRVLVYRWNAKRPSPSP